MPADMMGPLHVSVCATAGRRLSVSSPYVGDRAELVLALHGGGGAVVPCDIGSALRESAGWRGRVGSTSCPLYYLVASGAGDWLGSVNLAGGPHAHRPSSRHSSHVSVVGSAGARGVWVPYRWVRRDQS
jgi:hypothetical protein